MNEALSRTASALRFLPKDLWEATRKMVQWYNRVSGWCLILQKGDNIANPLSEGIAVYSRVVVVVFC